MKFEVNGLLEAVSARWVPGVQLRTSCEGRKMQYLYLWILSAALSVATHGLSLDHGVRIATPIFVVGIIIMFIRNSSDRMTRAHPYALFFVITITSALGITETLTGSHADSTSSYLFGLSFYTASLAFHAKSRFQHSPYVAFQIANPLLLFSGPIALFIRSQRHHRFSSRVNYYLPYILIGIFYYQAVAANLTKFFYMINYTDAASSITFAIIFEIFVYANFCGISLVIFGLFGLLGYRIPLNFRQPFSSNNIIEFWKGWHISLTTVLKSLFYAPIRSRFSSPIVPIYTVFIASALWHGFTANFVLWAFFHASIYIASLFFMKRHVRVVPTFLLIFGVIVGRLIFSDSNTERLADKLSINFIGFDRIINSLLDSNASTGIAALTIGLVLVSIEYFFKEHKSVKKRNYKHLRSPAALLLLTIIGVLLIHHTGGEYAVYGQR
ncbi:MAG: hypothetical protein H7831_11965 [Magnetococcus sp. WYHC-3]